MASADAEQQWLDAQRRVWNVPGVSVAIVRAGAPARMLVSGMCNLEQRIACTPEMPFQIGSMSKFFTGLVAASLAADKMLQMDVPVIGAWPEFRLGDRRWMEVTLRDLLSGRSGLGSIDWPYFWDSSLTRNDYLARLVHVPLVRPFRANWSYANANYVAAGAYLERVTGKSWETLVRERLFIPLDMRSSGFMLAPGTTRGYGLDPAGRDVLMAPAETKAIGPAGAIVSNGQDMVHWLTMLVGAGKWEGRQAVPAAALASASASVIGTGYDRRFYNAPGSYGFGVFLAGYHDRAIVHHGGGYPGYTAHFAWLPQQKIAVAVLTNRNASEFAEALTQAMLDREQG